MLIYVKVCLEKNRNTINVPKKHFKHFDHWVSFFEIANQIKSKIMNICFEF